MIFPEVNIQVRFQDMLINVSLAVIAIGTFFWTLMTGVKFTNEITTLISVLVGKVLQSFTALMAKQKQYAALMSKAILAKSDNSQLGMLMHLMESMEDQECKEMILSYCILSANVKSMTLKEIDTKCEFLLQRRFNLKVDFDVEGAMVKLMREGLVEQRAGVLYTATPLRKALQRLDTKWDNLFNYTEDGGAAYEVEPCHAGRKGASGAVPDSGGRTCQNPRKHRRRTRRGGRQAQGAAGRNCETHQNSRERHEGLQVAHRMSVIYRRTRPRVGSWRAQLCCEKKKE